MISYSPVGDLIVIAVCIVMFVLLMFSYVRNSRSYKMFFTIILLLVAAAMTDVSFHFLAYELQLYEPAYVLRCIFHAILFLIFVMYAVYIAEVTSLSRKQKWPFLITAILIFLVVVTLDVVNTLSGRGIRISEGGIEAQTKNVFIYGYVAFLILMVVFLVAVRNKIYRKVMYGFYGTITVSFFVLMIQGIHGQTSFTVSTFLYPVLAMMYFLHSNPYDANLGSVDSSALEERVRFYHERGIEFAYVSFQLCLFDDEQRELPDEFQTLIREFSTRYFRNGMLFQISKGHSVLIFIKKRNKDYEERFCRMKEAFRKEYEKFRLDYKFLIGSSIDEISEKNEYISFIRGIMRKMDVNTIHRVDRSDIDHFKKAEYIRKELGDIYRKRDMDDPRVLVYCQPVYNIRTGKYDTAEALMRLKLDETGLVFPDWFIPMAEESGFIHVLTQIMLHKTCLAVSELVRTGYDLKRVSVNVSVLELKEEDFCRNIEQIIEESGVESERIAIELTESRNENDFALMKQKIDELKDMGIKFYLDDFGTGYSNMERIMELPFDIIKFDRSLVLACESSERSHTLVLSLANMFASMQYAVLYEGVEEESDEKMCMEMFASYLQGYRYSRPIPIGELRNYCSR